MTVAMDRMSWPEYRARIDAAAPVFLAIGAIEQHGPHLPLGVDTMIPQAIAMAVAERTGAVVAAPITYGYKSQPRSGGGQDFPGTTSLDGTTLIAILKDLLKEFARHGARRIVLFEGHYENAMFVVEAIDLAQRELRWEGVAGLAILRVSYWEFIRAETLAAVFPEGFPGWALEHASIMETSVMLHLHPDLVHIGRAPEDGPGRFPTYDRYPLPPGHVPPSGILSTVRGASAEKGRLLFENFVDDITSAIAQDISPRT